VTTRGGDRSDLEFVEIARVIKPHGLRGGLGVLPFSSGSQTLMSVREVRLVRADGSTELRELAEVRPMQRGFLVRLVGVEGREAAEAYRDAVVAVERAELPDLPEHEAYAFDLVGGTVLGPEGTVEGTILAVVEYPSVDALVVDRGEGRRAEIPLLEDWILDIDADSKTVTLRSVEGILE